MDVRTVVIGTRKSRLARVQTDFVQRCLQEHFKGLEVRIVEVTTKGDTSQSKDEPLPSIGGKGLFTAELEAALAERSIDIAVHSLKDLPTKGDPRFCLGAICERESVHDILISRDGKRLSDLPRGAIIGTSSLRREAQIRTLRPDLQIQTIRGNVDTRINKLRTPGLSFEAIVLAEAGVNRLGRASEITQTFDLREMVPAAGQGALGIQCRSDDGDVRELLSTLNHYPTEVETTVEREFLEKLEAGCNTPLGCIARFKDGRVHVFARALSRDGQRCMEAEEEGPAEYAGSIGRCLGEEMLIRGVKNLEL